MSTELSIPEMYKIRNNHHSFGMESYIAPREYLDPNAVIKDRELQEMIKKG